MKLTTWPIGYTGRKKTKMQIEKRYVAEERNASGKLRGVAYYSSVDEFEREMNAIADCWTPEAGTTVTLYDTWESYDQFGITHPAVRTITCS